MEDSNRSQAPEAQTQQSAAIMQDCFGPHHALPPLASYYLAQYLCSAAIQHNLFTAYIWLILCCACTRADTLDIDDLPADACETDYSWLSSQTNYDRIMLIAFDSVSTIAVLDNLAVSYCYMQTTCHPFYSRLLTI